MSGWAERYVGRPYLGSPTGVHCWALVREVLRDQAGVEVPEYGMVDARELSSVSGTIDRERADPGQWELVQYGQEREFDVVVMRGWMRDQGGGLRRGVAHVGVVTEPGRVLHVDNPHDAVVSRLDCRETRPRVVAIYRHRGLA